MDKNKLSAYTAALRFLNYRALSEYEVAAKLRQKGYEEEEITLTLKRLRELGFVNDNDLAEEVFSFYKRRGVYGNLYIRGKLKTRGLPLEYSMSYEEEREQAEEFLKKRSLLVPALKTETAKAAAFLTRRGYSSAVIAAIIGKISSE